MRYVYHYHATCNETGTELDGLMTWSFPITTMEQYRDAKHVIGEQEPRFNPRALTIKALTLLHTLED